MVRSHTYLGDMPCRGYSPLILLSVVSAKHQTEMIRIPETRKTLHNWRLLTHRIVLRANVL